MANEIKDEIIKIKVLKKDKEEVAEVRFSEMKSGINIEIPKGFELSDDEIKVVFAAIQNEIIDTKRPKKNAMAKDHVETEWKEVE